MRLTYAKLERELRAVLVSGRATLKTARFRDHCADVNLARKPHPIRVDTFHVGMLSAVIHECLHVSCDTALSLWGELEEPVVAAVEDEIIKYVNRRPRLHAAWRKAIEEALDA